MGRRAAAAEASNASAKWDSRSFVQGQSQIMTASFENYVDKYSEPNGKGELDHPPRFCGRYACLCSQQCFCQVVLSHRKARA